MVIIHKLFPTVSCTMHTATSIVVESDFKILTFHAVGSVFEARFGLKCSFGRISLFQVMFVRACLACVMLPFLNCTIVT